MPIKLEDLNPRSSEFELNGKVYILKPFTFTIRVWAATEFATKENDNGLFVLAGMIRNLEANIDASLSAVTRVIYKLLVDNSDFKDYEDFFNKVAKYSKIMPMYYALVECIGFSEPQISELEKEQLEVKK